MPLTPPAEINAILAGVAEQKKAYDLTVKEGFDAILKTMFDANLLSFIYAKGYTPGFNDGEPCEHTSYEFHDVHELISDEIIGHDGDGEATDMFERAGLHTLIAMVDTECKEYLGLWGHPGKEAMAELERRQKAFAEIGHVYRHIGDDGKTINHAVNTIVAEGLERQYGTNFQVLIYRSKDGKITTIHEEYDCGY